MYINNCKGVEGGVLSFHKELGTLGTGKEGVSPSSQLVSEGFVSYSEFNKNEGTHSCHCWSIDKRGCML